MAGKYDDLARSILENVGGAENVTSVAHCITRVRFKLKDESRANTPKIEALKGVIQVIQANGQYQVVVGNIVEDVYDAVLEAGGLAGGGSAAEDEPEGEKTVASVIIDLISGIFQPILGPLAAAGIMKGLLALFTYFVPDFANDGLYTLLYTVADGFFYFLPVALAFSAARKFRMNEFTGVAIGVALVYPTMVALTSGEVLGSIDLGVAGTFSWYATALGIPIIMPASGYASSVIPVLLMVWFGSLVERWLKGWMPAALKMFLVPLATMTVSIVLGYLVIGPVATLITNLLSVAFSFIFQLPVVGAVLGSALVGGLWMCLVIFGFHWSLIPISIMNLNTLGHDYVLAATIGHGFALGAVIFAMYLRNRDERFRGIALPAMISAFFFGVTEPGIYGVALPNKRAFVVACLSSAVGGAIVGMTGALMYISGGLGVFNLLNFIDETPGGAGISHMVFAIVASLVSAVLAFVVEFVTYRPDAEEGAPELAPVQTEYERGTVCSPVTGYERGTVCSPVTGTVVQLSETPDPVFSSGAMGVGVAVVPDGETVFSPVSGTVLSAMPHAVGILSDDGAEVLVHVGIDTVEMGGDGLTCHVAQDSRVAAGDPIVTFSKEKVAAAGKRDTVFVIVTNSDDFASVTPRDNGAVTVGSPILHVVR